jgi:hypothetical protein
MSRRIVSAGALATVLTFTGLAVAQDEGGGDTDATAKKEVKKKKGGGPKFKLSGLVGGGFDSNAYNRAENDTTTGMGEARVKAGLDYAFLPILSWSNGVQVGGSFRGGEQTAAKVKAGANTKLTLLLFGNKKVPGGRKVPKKKQKFPAGTLTFGVKYGFSANPVIQVFETADDQPIEDPTALEEEFVGDPEIDEVVADDDVEEDTSEDDAEFEEEDDSEDDVSEDDASEDAEADEEAEGDEETEQAEAEEDDAFAEEDVLTESFGLANPKHKIGADTRFTVQPWKKTMIGLGLGIDRNLVGSDEGKPSANATRYGGAIKLEQKLWKLGLGAQYGLDYRVFDEKTTKAGDPLRFVIHAPGVYAKAKFGILKLKLAYRYQTKLTGLQDPLDSFGHGLKLSGQLALTKNIALTAQTGYAFSGRLDTTDKDSTRFQGFLGLQMKI